MENLFRVELLLGKQGLNLLKQKEVFVFGIGGVGSYCAEALARTGIGKLHLIDFDVIEETNLNRQIQTHYGVLGKSKADVMKERIMKYNPETEVIVWNRRYPDEELNDAMEKADYVADCIDMVSAKLVLIEWCNRNQIPIISSMGTANKMHPQLLEISDIYKTSYCPLAKVMRKECKQRAISSLKVVYSKEEPLSVKEKIIKDTKQVNGTLMYVPATAGLLIASEIINFWIKENVL